MGQAGEGERASRQADEMFCRNCGSVMSREAAICVACGVAARPATVVTYSGGHAGTGEGKSKSASIVLAILFGFFTWLYTYREDSGKFWLSLGANVVMFVLTILTLGLFAFIWFPASIGFWVWSIIDTATKKDAWYENY
jgi:hypothetical protein